MRESGRNHAVIVENGGRNGRFETDKCGFETDKRGFE